MWRLKEVGHKARPRDTGLDDFKLKRREQEKCELGFLICYNVTSYVDRWKYFLFARDFLIYLVSRCITSGFFVALRQARRDQQLVSRRLLLHEDDDYGEGAMDTRTIPSGEQVSD